MQIFYYSLVIIFLFLKSQNVLAQDDWQVALENFVSLKLSNYTTWMQMQGLDPSPALRGPTLVQTSGLHGVIDYYLENHRLEGLSLADMQTLQVEARLSEGLLTISMNATGILKFNGDFHAHGTIDNEYVSGYGQWHAEFGQVIQHKWGITYTVNPNGYLNPNGFFAQNTDLNGYSSSHFTMLFDSGPAAQHEDDLKQEFGESFGAYVENDLEHPLKQMFYQYLREVFASTPWPVIIRPPPSGQNARSY